MAKITTRGRGKPTKKEMEDKIVSFALKYFIFNPSSFILVVKFVCMNPDILKEIMTKERLRRTQNMSITGKWCIVIVVASLSTLVV